MLLKIAKHWPEKMETSNEDKVSTWLHFVIRGDFNVTLDLLNDKSSDLNTAHTRARKSILHFMKDLSTEIWQELNANNIEYSCHCGTHTTYSWIDYFLIPTQLRYKIDHCQMTAKYDQTMLQYLLLT